jgi:diacylglycerol kinase family enzyme
VARVGVLINARAGAVRRDGELVTRIGGLVPASALALTRSEAEVGAALGRLREQGIESLVLIGGDGSVHVALTALLKVWQAADAPALLLTRGGTINTIPSSLGARGAPDAMLARLLSRGPRAEQVRPALRVRTGDGEERCGLVYAVGAASRFLELYYGSSTRGSFGAAVTLARSMGSVLLHGALARSLFAPFEARIRIDGDPYQERSFTVIAVAAVRHIGLGFQPFLSAGVRADRFHLAMTRDGGRRIALEMPWYRFGVRPRWSCIVHASPSRVQIETTDAHPYTLDGDLFPPTKSARIEATPRLRFLSV